MIVRNRTVLPIRAVIQYLLIYILILKFVTLKVNYHSLFEKRLAKRRFLVRKLLYQLPLLCFSQVEDKHVILCQSVKLCSTSYVALVTY